MIDKPAKPQTFTLLKDIAKLTSPLLNLHLHPAMVSMIKINNQIVNIARPFSALTQISSFYQKQLSIFSEIFKNIDWGKFERAYRTSMVREFAKLRDERVTAILGQVLTEFWLNLFIKTLFSNSKQIQEMRFDTKRKILAGLRVINSGINSDLKLLADIRAEYAHNFVVDKKKVLKILGKMNRYKNLVRNKKLSKRNGNNVRIRKTALQLLFDLIDIEEKYVIEVQKISKAQKNKKLTKN